MDARQNLRANSVLQLALVVVIVVLVNTLASRHFFRLDLTDERLYTLDIVTRNLMSRLERPLVAKVYFTRGLEAPYNNHEQILVDKLDDLRAYSKGWMDVQVQDPTDRPEIQEEATRFGISPIPYLFTSASRRELKQVYMGLALVYGDRQEVIPAVASTEALEYELARAIKSLISTEEPKTVAFSVGSGEPSLQSASGPLQTLAGRIRERYQLAQVQLGGAGLLPEQVDTLIVVGPQQPLSARAQYQIDQLLMRGGSLAFFLTNLKPDMRTMRPQNVPHGLEPLLARYGVTLNRDILLDRQQNGRFPFPIRQGGQVVRQSLNYALMPKATMLNRSTALTKGSDSLLFPFASTLALTDPLPDGVSAEVIASSSSSSGRVGGLRTIDPAAFQAVLSSEETGSFPLLITLQGRWTSAFADQAAPPPPPGAPEDPAMSPDDPTTRMRSGAPARIAVAGSGDFVGNNLPFMLNLVDWLVQDEELVNIRAKAVELPELETPEAQRALGLKLVNILGGVAALLALGGARWLSRRPKGTTDAGGGA